jgi:arabinogalactan oligomer/maltooligosaccharide transport system substrate-binding protein
MRFCSACGAAVEVVAAVIQPKKKGPVIAIWSAAVALVLVLALVVSWSFGLFDGIFEDGLFGSSTVRNDDDDDDDDDDDRKKPTMTEPEDHGTTLPVNTEPSRPKITLRVWAPAEDQLDNNSWLPTRLSDFEALHPEYDITWELGICSEGDATTMVTSDVATAADVYIFPSDQMEQLIEADALARLGGAYLEQVLSDNCQTVVNTVTYADGGVYGFPCTGNTWFMYYDKSVYTEEDVKSLETMLEKGRVSFPLTNSWYLWSFYAAGGGTMFGPNGNDASAGIQLGENGADVTRYLLNMSTHPNFYNDADSLGIDGLRYGTVDAVFTGDWDARVIREVLGDNMGVAQLPTITLNGETRQLQSFAGSKAVGVNKQSKNMKAALQLASFLSDVDSQMMRYEMRGIIPTTIYALDYWQIFDDPVAMAQINTLQYTSCVQPTIMEMARYWTPASTMGYIIAVGEITEEVVEEQTKMFEQALNNMGL